MDNVWLQCALHRTSCAKLVPVTWWEWLGQWKSTRFRSKAVFICSLLCHTTMTWFFQNQKPIKLPILIYPHQIKLLNRAIWRRRHSWECQLVCLSQFWMSEFVIPMNLGQKLGKTALDSHFYVIFSVLSFRLYLLTNVNHIVLQILIQILNGICILPKT